MSWTDYLEESVDKFDVSLDWWYETHQRIERGMRCPYGFLDLSLQPIGRSFKEGTTFDKTLFRIFDPFKWELWLAFLGVTVGTGVVFFFLEGGNWCRKPTDKTSMELLMKGKLYKLLKRFVWALYGSIAQFTGASKLAPKTTVSPFNLHFNL